jgi:hypothetical protein
MPTGFFHRNALFWAPNSRDIYFLKSEQLATVSVDGEGNPTGRDLVLFLCQHTGMRGSISNYLVVASFANFF